MTDNGPGFAGEDPARVFEPFYSTKTAQGGTGPRPLHGAGYHSRARRHADRGVRVARRALHGHASRRDLKHGHGPHPRRRARHPRGARFGAREGGPCHARGRDGRRGARAPREGADRPPSPRPHAPGQAGPRGSRRGPRPPPRDPRRRRDGLLVGRERDHGDARGRVPLHPEAVPQRGSRPRREAGAREAAARRGEPRPAREARSPAASASSSAAPPRWSASTRRCARRRPRVRRSS